MKNLDLAALTYDAESDRLLGLYPSLDRKKAMIGMFDATGAAVGSVELPDPAILAALTQGPSGPPVQLIVVGGELAVITVGEIFAMDLETHKIRVTWKCP